MKNLFDNDIKVHRDRLEVARQLEEDKQEFKLLIEELEQIKNELNVNYEKIIKYIEIRPDETSRRIVERQQRTQQLFRGFNNDEEQGLTAQRILQFQQYVRRNRGLNNDKHQGLTAQRILQFQQYVRRNLGLNNDKHQGLTAQRILQFQQYVRRNRGLNNDEHQGLTAQRILQFQQYVRRNRGLNNMLQENMMRLDCDGEHTFCQVCIERWFATNKTCPICGHMFQ